MKSNFQAHLASVPNAETHEFLKGLGEGLEREIWIGGYQQGNTNWLWSDGTQWNSAYQGWIPGEPNARGSKCINMFVNEDHRWFDENCGNEYAFFCSAGQFIARRLIVTESVHLFLRCEMSQRLDPIRQQLLSSLRRKGHLGRSQN